MVSKAGDLNPSLTMLPNKSIPAGDSAGGPINGTGMGLRPRARRSRGPTEMKKRATGQSN